MGEREEESNQKLTAASLKRVWKTSSEEGRVGVGEVGEVGEVVASGSHTSRWFACFGGDLLVDD